MSELQEKVQQHHATLFGVEGQGGLVRDVETVQEKVAEHDKKLATMSLKWLLLMALVGILGNAVGQKLLSLDFISHLFGL